MLISDRVLRTIELAKQFCPGWEIAPEEEGYKCIRSFDDHTATVRLLEVVTDRSQNYNIRVLIYDSRDGDEDPIFRGRINISDDSNIVEKFNRWELTVALDNTVQVKKISAPIRSLLKNFDHALHRQAFEGSQIYLSTLLEFVSRLPEQKPPLIEGLINQGEIIMFYGPTNVGVTTLFMNLAAHALAGKDFLGFRIPRPVKRVGYLHFEGWPRQMERMAKKLARGFPGFPESLFYLREYTWKISDPDGEATLRNVITNRELEMVFIDNLINFIGSINVNDPSEVTDFVMSRLSNVSGSTGCPIIFAFHSGQPSLERSTGRTTHPGRPMSSVEFPGHSDLTVRYSFGDTREDPRILETDKIRSSETPSFRREIQHHPLTELLTLVEEPEAEEIAPFVSSEMVKEIREKLGLTQQELANKIGAGERTIKTWEAGDSAPQDEFRKKLWELYRETELEEI